MSHMPIITVGVRLCVCVSPVKLLVAQEEAALLQHPPQIPPLDTPLPAGIEHAEHRGERPPRQLRERERERESQ